MNAATGKDRFAAMWKPPKTIDEIHSDPPGSLPNKTRPNKPRCPVCLKPVRKAQTYCSSEHWRMHQHKGRYRDMPK